MLNCVQIDTHTLNLNHCNAELSTDPQGTKESTGNNTGCWIYVFTYTREIPLSAAWSCDSLPIWTISLFLALSLSLHTHTLQKCVQNSWGFSQLNLRVEKLNPDRQIGRPATTDRSRWHAERRGLRMWLFRGGGLSKIFCCWVHLMPLDGKKREAEREIEVQLKLDNQETPMFTICLET